MLIDNGNATRPLYISPLLSYTKIYFIVYVLGCSRYDIAIDALHSLSPKDTQEVAIKTRTLISNYRHDIHQHEKYSVATDVDPEDDLLKVFDCHK